MLQKSPSVVLTVPFLFRSVNGGVLCSACDIGRVNSTLDVASTLRDIEATIFGGLSDFSQHRAQGTFAQREGESLVDDPWGGPEGEATGAGFLLALAAVRTFPVQLFLIVWFCQLPKVGCLPPAGSCLSRREKGFAGGARLGGSPFSG